MEVQAQVQALAAVLLKTQALAMVQTVWLWQAVGLVQEHPHPLGASASLALKTAE
jgi:hypothetical protein